MTGQAQAAWVLVLAIAATGCGGRKSSLLLQRNAVGPMEDVTAVGQRGDWRLEPSTQTSAQDKVEITVTHGDPAFLGQLFQRQDIFGEYAGRSPYFNENIVFYVKIANRGDKRIHVDPTHFVLIDGRGNQYSLLGSDYINAIAESKSPTGTVTRGVLDDFRPGYMGLSLPVGKMVPKSQGRYVLMERSALQKGYLYPGVVHDGLITFWSPVRKNETLRLLITSIKTDFAADDLPQKSLEFPFVFTATTQ